MKHLIILFFTCLSISTFAQQNIKWLTIEEAVALNETQPKKFFIDVYTDWCGWCKVMDQQTFQHPAIAAMINQYYHPVKLNAEQKNDIVIKGKTYKFVASGRNGYNEFAAEILQGKLSYPTIVYLDEKLGMLSPVPGFMKPKDIEPILKFFGTNAHLSSKWEEYQKTFTSTIPE